MKKNYSLVLLCSGIIVFGNFSFAQEQKQISDDNFIQKMKADGASDETINLLNGWSLKHYLCSDALVFGIAGKYPGVLKKLFDQLNIMGSEADWETSMAE